MRAGVARRQGRGRGGGIDRQGPRGAVVDGRLGEGAEVPGRSGVVAAQCLAAVQPGQGSVQQRRPAHLAPCVGKGEGPGERQASESSPQRPSGTWASSPSTPASLARQSPHRPDLTLPDLGGPSSTWANIPPSPLSPHQCPIKSRELRACV